MKERNETCALFSLVVVQQPDSRPACSCKDIRESGNSKGDEKYWIDPENSGNALKVYCDMTTDRGSWFVMFYETFFLNSGIFPHQTEQKIQITVSNMKRSYRY